MQNYLHFPACAIPDSGDFVKKMCIRDRSNVILPPSGLSARVTEDGKVELAWTAPQEGAPVLSDGFEDMANPNGWTIKNAGDRGWTWQEAAKNYMPYSGNYSMYMKSAWEDKHQDERLISPVFAYGRELSFWSKSIAPQKDLSLIHIYSMGSVPATMSLLCIWCMYTFRSSLLKRINSGCVAICPATKSRVLLVAATRLARI